ncbi:LysR substrate-binding domain-containing protein, partial [Enterococcus faecium]|uniref:LysR substrate-binding domain-containing protein n=1 Tax=Enterococcus faecium TaxID=1352 RepID=UPI0039FBE4D5
MLQSLERATKLDGSFPDCRMEYQALPSSKQIDLLRAKRLDLGLIHTVAPMNDLIVQGIGSFPLGVDLSTGHPLASRDSL